MAFYRPRDPLNFHFDKQVAGCARSCTSCCLPGKEIFYLLVYPADVSSIISTVDAQLLVLVNTIESADTLEQLIIFMLDDASMVRGAGPTPPLPATCRALRHPIAARTDTHGWLFVLRFYVSIRVSTRMTLECCVGQPGSEKMKVVGC